MSEKVEVMQYTIDEASLLGRGAELSNLLFQHDEHLRTATGFDGIELAANAQDEIMEKLPAFLVAVTAMLNANVEGRLASQPKPYAEGYTVANGTLLYDSAAIEAVQRLLERGQATVNKDGYLELVQPKVDDRDAIVAWLREDAKTLFETGRDIDLECGLAITECADAIEQGEHLRTLSTPES